MDAQAVAHSSQAIDAACRNLVAESASQAEVLEMAKIIASNTSGMT